MPILRPRFGKKSEARCGQRTLYRSLKINHGHDSRNGFEICDKIPELGYYVLI